MRIRDRVRRDVTRHLLGVAFGHRYLVEKAAGENDFVHLFVLSEEAGPIPFALRRRLVQDGVADIPNVVLHDSGPYIISSATFPSYFLKDGDDAIRAQAALDVAVFGEIAHALGVTRRYVGDEPTSRVTSLYNEVMAARLPELGVTPWKETTYKRACEEGWAPAPTNEYQKAVWDKVHAIPDQPLKIKYQKPDQSPNTGK